jgi:hypothetical protein
MSGRDRGNRGRGGYESQMRGGRGEAQGFRGRGGGGRGQGPPVQVFSSVVRVIPTHI